MNLFTSHKKLYKETVPLHCTEKISLSHNSSGQFQTTQNDKGINFLVRLQMDFSLTGNNWDMLYELLRKLCYTLKAASLPCNLMNIVLIVYSEGNLEISIG